MAMGAASLSWTRTCPMQKLYVPYTEVTSWTLARFRALNASTATSFDPVLHAARGFEAALLEAWCPEPEREKIVAIVIPLETSIEKADDAITLHFFSGMRPIFR